MTKKFCQVFTTSILVKDSSRVCEKKIYIFVFDYVDYRIQLRRTSDEVSVCLRLFWQTRLDLSVTDRLILYGTISRPFKLHTASFIYISWLHAKVFAIKNLLMMYRVNLSFVLCNIRIHKERFSVFVVSQNYLLLFA